MFSKFVHNSKVIFESFTDPDKTLPRRSPDMYGLKARNYMIVQQAIEINLLHQSSSRLDHQPYEGSGGGQICIDRWEGSRG